MSINHPGDLHALVESLQRARGASQLFLRMALEAMRTPGAAGTLRIHIPRKVDDPVEIEFQGLNGHPDLKNGSVRRTE